MINYLRSSIYIPGSCRELVKQVKDEAKSEGLAWYKVVMRMFLFVGYYYGQYRVWLEKQEVKDLLKEKGLV